MMPGGYVPGGSATLEDIITGYGKQKADIAQTQASTAGTQQQTAVNAQIEQAHQLQNEATQRALRDQQIATEALGGVKRTNADGTPRAPREMIGEVSSAMRKGGATLGATFGLEKQLMDSIEGYNKMDEGTRKLHDENYAKVGSLLGAIQEAPPEQQAALWAQSFPELNRLEPGTFSQEFPGADKLKGQTGLHGGLGAILGHQKTQAELDKDKAQAALDAAKTPGEKAESDKKVLITQAMQEALKDPTKGAAAIDAILPASIDAEGNTAYKAAYNAAMQSGGPEAAQKIVEAVAAHAGRHADTVNPAIAAAKTKQAVAEQAALAPGKQAEAVATARALSPIHVAEQVSAEVAKAKLAPDSFNSIIDPRARTAAEGDYAKDSKEYAEKVSEARRLTDLITAAQGGNKAAPGLIPIEELRGFVNRVNARELEQVGSGAGSSLDRVQGWLKGKTEGQPVPPDILRDTAKIADLNEKATRRGYEFKVQINNKTHGGNVKPIDFAAPAGKPVRARDPQGNLHEAPAGTALPAGWKEEK